MLGELERRYESAGEGERAALSRCRTPRPCPECDGARIRLEARSVKLGGASIDAVSRLSVTQAADFLDGLELRDAQRPVADPVLREIQERLRFRERRARVDAGDVLAHTRHLQQANLRFLGPVLQEGAQV